MIKIFGDLTKVKNSFICQQVNCMGVMGSGLAAALRTKYPSIYKDYKEFTVGKKADNLLGSTLIIKVEDENYISNMFSQKYFNNSYKSFVQTDYVALKECLLQSASDAKKIGFKEILVPHGLGSVLGGGSWLKVSEILLEVEQESGCSIKCIKLK